LCHVSFCEKFLGAAGIIYRVLSLFALVVHVNRGIIISIGIRARFLKSNHAESSSVFLRDRSWTIAKVGPRRGSPPRFPGGGRCPCCSITLAIDIRERASRNDTSKSNLT